MKEFVEAGVRCATDADVVVAEEVLVRSLRCKGGI